jgi:hypothetical protein
LGASSWTHSLSWPSCVGGAERWACKPHGPLNAVQKYIHTMGLQPAGLPQHVFGDVWQEVLVELTLLCMQVAWLTTGLCLCSLQILALHLTDMQDVLQPDERMRVVEEAMVTATAQVQRMFVIVQFSWWIRGCCEGCCEE